MVVVVSFRSFNDNVVLLVVHLELFLEEGDIYDFSGFGL